MLRAFGLELPMTITDLIVISLPEHNAKSLSPSSGSQ
jgi:hypothetical protein